MTNIKDILDLEVEYGVDKTIKVRDLGKVDAEIKWHEYGSINSATPGKESNYRSVESTGKNKHKKVDIVSLIKEIYNPEEINNVEIEKFENKKTFTGKIGLNFQYKKVDNDLGRNTVTTHQVKIVSNQRLKYLR
tara:strand:+ start:73 stop:474 length:402 start_codon:yes stop_codon:yes gene_type:complete